MRSRGFLFKLAVLNTFKRRVRAGLAVGGIALSSAVMILLFGVSAGLKELVTQEVSNADTANVITVNQRNIQQVPLDQEKLSKIRSISGVADVQQLVGTVGDVTYHGMTISLPLYAVTNEFFKSSPAQVTGGDIAGQPTGSNVILSSKALEAFNISSSEAKAKKVEVRTSIPEVYAAVGKTDDEREVKPAEFSIVGSVDKGSLPVAYIPLEHLVQNGLQNVSQLKVTVSYPEKMAAVRESIEQMGYQTTSLQDSIDQVNRIFSVIQRIIMVFGVIALAITVIGTFNVITLTLIEEMKQVAFLRLSGMQKSSVRFLFTAQAIMLTMAGATSGVAAGLLLGAMANGAARGLVGETAFVGTIFIFKIPVMAIIIILMLSVVLGWLIALMPAKRAVTIGPLEGLQS